MDSLDDTSSTSKLISDGTGCGPGTLALLPRANADESINIGDLDPIHLDFVRKQQKIFDVVMRDYPVSVGKSVSKKDRDRLHLSKSTLVYGEISFVSFGVALMKIKYKYGLPNIGSSGPQGILQRAGGVFADIGAGTAKPVFAAAVLHPWDAAKGVELLEGLYQTSVSIREAFDTDGRPLLRFGTITDVQLACGDMLDPNVMDWTDADVAFANSTCFDDAIMRAIGRLAGRMKRGAFIISLTKPVPSPSFQVLEYEIFQMSWGGATVYIQQKTTEPEEVAVPAPEAGPEAAEEEEEEEEEGEAGADGAEQEASAPSPSAPEETA